ncbi:penicillin-binding transpeptidase domain-containing protein [Arthrobacter sp. 260]|uniref:penicillin-binding transpeptidase domain-containing protein n=1 Tax=Arthrobacter sp. 260 TaxID=2735314 RepID=UPI00149207AA|nr:penicillin-binding transpeptidase domain-containing protein [Arthrobacter sp. 260]NOJ60111.1 penicillin-binding protein [Arthrobacter sp. 260]
MGNLRRTTSVATIAALALALTACTDTGPTAEDAAATFAEGLTAQDVTGSTFTSGSAAEVNEELAAITEALDPLTLAVSVGAVETASEDAATVQLNHVWDLDDSDDDWAYTTTVDLSLVDDVWQVDWDPAVAVDGLEPGQVLTMSSSPAERGDILGADGEVLVTDRPVLRVGIDKTQLEADQLGGSAGALAELVGVDPTAFTAQVEGAGPEAFVEAIVLRDDDSRPVTDAELAAVPGALAVPDELALAPTRTFARELLGSVGLASAEMIEQSDGELAAGDVTGLSGLQLQHNVQLAGTPGLVVSAVPAEQTEAATEPVVLFEKDPVPGDPLSITLDQTLQSLAEGVLEDEPSASSIVALRPSTGEILTVANGPGSAGLQTALLGQYPPGSTFKVATSLALLREGFTPESTTQCTEELVVDGRSFNNASTYPAAFLGEIPLLQTFAQSCNTGFIATRDVVSQEELAGAAADLGVGVEASIGIPAFFGSVPETAEGTAHAASMIGQGEVLVSPLALAVMTASVGAGERVTPTLLAADPAGDTASAPAGESDPSPSPAGTPSALTVDEAGTLRTLMAAVVAEGGATVLADVPGDPVLAKTGTAEFGDEDPPRTHAWIVALQGDLAVAVFVEEGELGSTSGGPLMDAFLSGAAG